MTTAYIALGSNLGKRQLALRAALDHLSRLPATRVLKTATFRETAPVGGPPGQGPYINSAVAVETALAPRDLLTALLSIEHTLGRDRSTETRNGPRTADLDLLLYGDQIINEPHLTVPHPRLHQRLFVLEPLAEIAPDTIHPVLHQSIRNLLQNLRKVPS
jgi:2-amino-4-hydroxy-6-hydroxymethyldihydropteridine diphosphokinase